MGFKVLPDGSIHADTLEEALALQARKQGAAPPAEAPPAPKPRRAPALPPGAHAIESGGYTLVCQQCGQRFFSKRRDADRCLTRCADEKQLAEGSYSGRLFAASIDALFEMVGRPLTTDEVCSNACVSPSKDAVDARLAKLEAAGKIQKIGASCWALPAACGRRTVMAPAEARALVLMVVKDAGRALRMPELVEAARRAVPDAPASAVERAAVALYKAGELTRGGKANSPAYSLAAPPSAPVLQHSAPQPPPVPVEIPPAAVEPKKRKPRALLVGGVANVRADIEHKLNARFGVEVVGWWEMGKRAGAFPADLDLVVILADMASNELSAKAAGEAREAEVPVVRGRHKWSALADAVMKQWQMRVVREQLPPAPNGAAQ